MAEKQPDVTVMSTSEYGDLVDTIVGLSTLLVKSQQDVGDQKETIQIRDQTVESLKASLQQAQAKFDELRPQVAAADTAHKLLDEMGISARNWPLEVRIRELAHAGCDQVKEVQAILDAAGVAKTGRNIVKGVDEALSVHERVEDLALTKAKLERAFAEQAEALAGAHARLEDMRVSRDREIETTNSFVETHKDYEAAHRALNELEVPQWMIVHGDGEEEVLPWCGGDPPNNTKRLPLAKRLDLFVGMEVESANQYVRAIRGVNEILVAAGLPVGATSNTGAGFDDIIKTLVDRVRALAEKGNTR